MIDDVDSRLEQWSEGQLPGVPVAFAPSAEAPRGSAVHFYLVELSPDGAARGGQEPAPFKLRLHYLVTTWAAQPKEMHRMLGLLMFAAMDQPDWEVSASPAPALWRALSVAARPAFGLYLPLLHERPRPKLSRVRVPLILKHSPMRPLQGRLLGPDEVAIAGATVELPALRLATRTDHQGRFLFPAVPADPPVSLLRVNAKGREISITPQRPLAPDQPLIIQLSESEI